MSAILDAIEDEFKSIPGKLVNNVQNDVANAWNQLTGNLRTDVANAVNQTGAGLTSGLAGKIAPSGSTPVTIPLSSGQLAAVVIGLALLIGYAIYSTVKK